MEKEIVYIGDPLCSWCWGIAPELQDLRRKYESEFPFRVVVGGLRPFVFTPMTRELKEYVRHHWEEVAKRSGQPFKFDLLDGEDPFVYDTEPPCRAVVAVRHLAPEHTFDFFKKIQYAFYAENKDTHLLETYLPLLADLPISEKDFQTTFESEEIRKATLEDFAWSKDAGIGGFPSVVVRHGDQWNALAMGYATSERMIGALEAIQRELSG